MTETYPVNQRSQKVGRLVVIIVAGMLLILWLSLTPPGLLGKADAIGYAVCHRIDLRSFHLGARQLPLCARCSGMYLGAMLGLTIQVIKGHRSGMPPKKILILLGLMALIFIFDGVDSFLSLFPGFPTLYEPSNTLRLITGTGMGLVIAALLMPAFHETFWRDRDERPAIGDFRSLGIWIILASLLDLLVLTENPLILYPLALISAAGVLVLLTMIYSMLWVMLFKRENRFRNFREISLPVISGFTFALFQIALLDFGRYLLTGTWQGFHFG